MLVQISEELGAKGRQMQMMGKGQKGGKQSNLDQLASIPGIGQFGALAKKGFNSIKSGINSAVNSAVNSAIGQAGGGIDGKQLAGNLGSFNG